MVPSFEQISQAIEDAIGESLANQNLDSSCEDAILSPEHQLMNTWCWLNIKVELNSSMIVTLDIVHCQIILY